MRMISWALVVINLFAAALNTVIFFNSNSIFNAVAACISVIACVALIYTMPSKKEPQNDETFDDFLNR